MAQRLMLLHPQLGQKRIEQFQSGRNTVLAVGLLYLGNIDGALKHLAAVIILCGHIPDLVYLLSRTLREVILNKFFHLLPGA